MHHSMVQMTILMQCVQFVDELTVCGHAVNPINSYNFYITIVIKHERGVA